MNINISCPNCLSRSIKECNDGTYQCRSCGNRFDNAPVRPAAQASAPLEDRIDRSAPTLTGEDIYDACIKGCAIIECHDLGCAGSGFLADSYGHVITNAHVIVDDNNRPSKDVYVTLNGQTARAEVVKCGSPDDLDVALLRVLSPIPGMKPLPMADSTYVRNGEKVYAIGNSLGEGLMITVGIISDNKRMYNGRPSFLSDVSTNPGNSGGPMVDEDGQVIAICVAHASRALVGMRYFIPINHALEFVGCFLKR